MKNTFILVLFILIGIFSNAQVVVDPKGTKITLDSSKWKSSGNNIYNKNGGNIGIGTSTPSAQLHTTGDVRFAGIGTSTTNTKILTADPSGNITTRAASELFPINSGKTFVTLNADVQNKNTVGNTLMDIPGLSFNVSAGIIYRFYAIIPYTSEATNNGSRWTINAPVNSLLNFVTRNNLSDNTETTNYCFRVNYPLSCNQNSNAIANIAIIQGIIKPTENGIFQVRFASETGNVGITAKAGATLEYW